MVTLYDQQYYTSINIVPNYIIKHNPGKSAVIPAIAVITAHLMPQIRKKRIKFGLVEQKILLLLVTGLALGLTRRPDRYFRIIKSAAKEWREINQRSLRGAIRKLNVSETVDYKEDANGSVSIILNDNGRRQALRYQLNSLKLPRSQRWDGHWRLVIFDIPEFKKKGRDALAAKMKHLGLLPLQKSVFIYPYDCRKEIEFVAEIFEVRPYLRFIIAQDIDGFLDLQQKFHLV